MTSYYVKDIGSSKLIYSSVILFLFIYRYIRNIRLESTSLHQKIFDVLLWAFETTNWRALASCFWFCSEYKYSHYFRVLTWYSFYSVIRSFKTLTKNESFGLKTIEKDVSIHARIDHMEWKHNSDSPKCKIY